MAHTAFPTRSLHPEMHVKDTSAFALRQEGRSGVLEPAVGNMGRCWSSSLPLQQAGDSKELLPQKQWD